jgi:hypothetical protein
VCFERMFDKFAPYRILSTAGSTRTEILGLHSAGIKLLLDIYSRRDT